MSSENSTLHVPGGPAPSGGGGEAMPQTIGDFAIRRRLGAGAMGEVFLGKHRETKAEVAIKVVSARLAGEDGFLRRFEREIAVLTTLDHPHIAKAFAHGIHEGRAWLAMEFVRGPSLADIQKAHGALHEDHVLRLAIQIAQGLEYVHQKAGLIHRDIKPANVLIAVADGKKDTELESHVAKIIDFGLAKTTGESDQGLTMTGMVMGTPFYMSPEQIRGEKDIDLRTDIYALGATMFHLLTNALPYDGSSPGIVMTGHLTARVPDPGERVPSLHKTTRKVVMTAMAKAAKDRFVSWTAFVSACEKALEELMPRDGVGTLRLLRKPLVLPPVQSKTPVQLPVLEDEPDPFAQTLPNGTRREVKDDAKPNSRALAAKPRADRVDRPRPSPSRAAGERTPAEPRVAGTQATEALRKVHTERVRRLQTDAESVRVGASGFNPPPVLEPQQSAAYRREKTPTPVLPLIILLMSVVALIVYLAMRR